MDNRGLRQALTLIGLLILMVLGAGFAPSRTAPQERSKIPAVAQDRGVPRAPFIYQPWKTIALLQELAAPQFYGGR